MPSAQRVQWAKLRITVVIISALSILGVLMYLLSGGTWLKPKAYLVTFMPDASGLARGSDVELNGVDIGKVDSLSLTKSKDPNLIVEVRMKIEGHFLRHIPVDSVTSVDSETMLGDKYIDITMGKSPEHIEADGELRYQPPTNFFKSIDIEQFGAQLRSIDQVIRDIQEGKGGLGEFVTTDEMYRDVISKITDIERGLRAAVNVHSRLGQFLYGADTYNDISTRLRQLDDRLAQVQSNPYLRDSAQYDNIHDQIAKIRSTLADLKAGKGAGGQLLASDSAYREWQTRLAGWINSIDALDSGEGGLGQMFSNAETYESLNGKLQDLATTMREFRQNPEKFMRFKLF
jgi:phospholipid/cholesterol/gamma-HCH transport system substrate-binding protein